MRSITALGGALLLLLLLVPLATQAQFTYSTNFTYVTNSGVVTTNGAITITGYTGPGGAVTIPDSINGYPVTQIGGQAFYNATNVTGVTISTNVSGIDVDAFAGAGLTSLAIPNSVTGIGTAAFDACASLTNVVIGNGVQDVGSGAFQSCENLVSVTLGSNVNSLEYYAFGYCSSLASVYFWGTPPALPNGAPSVVFYNDNDATVYYLAGTPGWGTTYDGLPTAIWIQYTWLTNADNSITLMQYYGGGGAVAIPGTVNGLPVTSIGDETFYDYASLTSVTIPNTVTNIGNEAFENCTGLAGVVIPTNVVDIGNEAFAGCIDLGSINIPNSVTNIGQAAFKNCSALGSAVISPNLTSISDETF